MVKATHNNPLLLNPNSDGLQQIQKPSIMDLVVERIRAAVHFGYFLPGDQLPPERDIAEILGVSRANVNQAMKTLRDEGYLVSKRGPTGAAIVTSLKKPAKKRQDELLKNKAQFHQLMEFRAENEALAASLAAQRRTQADLQAISASIELMATCEDAARFRRYDLEFHLAVARASNNPYVEHVVQLARDHLFLLIGDFNDVILSSTLNAHRKVYLAIKNADSAGAEAAMRDHLTESEQEFSSDFS